MNPRSIELRSVDYERIFNLLGMVHVGNASTCILSIYALIQKRAFHFSITILEKKPISTMSKIESGKEDFGVFFSNELV